MIKPDVDIWKNATSKRGKGKRNDILTILNNIELGVFEGFSYHYSDKPSQSEESITDRTKLRRQRLNEIAKKEKEMSFDLFKKYLVMRVQAICTKLWMRQKTRKKTRHK